MARSVAWVISVWMALLAVGCGGGSTTSPTPAASTAKATLAFASASATVDPYVDGGFIYVLSLQLQETSGGGGASLSSMTVRLADGRSGVLTPGALITVGAHATYSTTAVLADTQATTPSPTLALTLTYADDLGHSGVTTTTATVTPMPRYALVGVVTDASSRQPLSKVSVAVTDITGRVLNAVTDGNGYYGVSGVAQGPVLVQTDLAGYGVSTQVTMVTGDTQFDVSLSKSATLTAPAPGSPGFARALRLGDAGECVSRPLACGRF